MVARPGGAITEELVRSLGEALGEPAWLTADRLRAARAGAGALHPTVRDEDWRRTPEEALDLTSVPFDLLPAAAAAERAATAAAPEPAAAGEPGPSPAAAPGAGAGAAPPGKGVFLADYVTAAHARPHLLAAHPLAESFPPGDNFLAALVLALGSGGFVLHVPAGVRLEEPVVLEEGLGAGDAPVLRPCLLVVERGASVRVVEVLTRAAPDGAAPTAATRAAPAAGGIRAAAPGVGRPSRGEAPAPLVASLLAIHVAEGAHLELTHVQAAGPNARCFAFRRAILREGAVLRWRLVQAGGRFARDEAHAWLDGSGARCEAVCAQVAAGGSHLDLAAGGIHQAPATTSRLLVHTAVGGEARAVFRGQGRIRRGAAGADLDQRHRVLLLSPRARADSRPALVIDENDVRASHGAAISPPDREQLFYLMSRGLTGREALRLLVGGFLRPALADLEAAAGGEELAARLEADPL